MMKNQLSMADKETVNLVPLVVIKAIKAQIIKNPISKQKLMALQMGLRRKTVKTVLIIDSELQDYKRKNGHPLN